MTFKQLKIFFFIKKTIICVQVTMPGIENVFLHAKDDLLCEKAVFPKI